MTTVEILDSITGSGKTSGICKWMDDNHEKYKYIYVSPLLSEVEEGGRVHRQCLKTRFVAPSNDGYLKIDNLLELLKQGVNITCTHSLYLSMTNEHFKVIEEIGYVVIIDEELGMISGYNDYSEHDLNSLISLGIVTKNENDGLLEWNTTDENYEQPTHKYNSFKRHVQAGLIYACKRSNKMMTVQTPSKLLEIARRVIIITYMFEGNILSAFLKLKGIQYIPFTEVETTFVSKQDIKDLITLYYPKQKKWEKIKTFNMSYSWYLGKSGKRINSTDIDLLSKFIPAITNQFNAKAYDTMYTFPKCRSVESDGRMLRVTPKGFKSNVERCWVASNTRATNSLSHKWCLIHLYNRYPSQPVKSYLQDYGVTINDDVFALSELIQWTWRSRIRNGKEIVLCIANDRMLGLFERWLNDEQY